MKLALFLTICGVVATHAHPDLTKHLGLLQGLASKLTPALAPSPEPVPAAPKPSQATRIKYIHHLQEVPVPVVRQVPVFQEVVKYVDRPIIVEKRVPVNVTVYKDKIIEKPVEKIVYKDKIVHKTVEVPVVHVQYVDRPVQVTKFVPYEKIVEKTVQVPVERKVESIKEVEVVKEKIVEKPKEVVKTVPFETIVQVPYDRLVHVHEPQPFPVVQPQPNFHLHAHGGVQFGQHHHLYKRALLNPFGSYLEERPRVGLLKKLKKIMYTNPLLTTALIGGTGAVLGGVAAKHYDDQIGLVDEPFERVHQSPPSHYHQQQHHHHNQRPHRPQYDDYDYEPDCK